MKIQKIYFLISITFFTIVSCNKKTDPVYPEQDFLQEYLIKSGFDSPLVVTIPKYTEFGMSFKPTSTIEISSINAKLPIAISNFKVSIWEKFSQDLIYSTPLNIPKPDTLIKKIIPKLVLNKDVEYLLSYYSSDIYQHSNSNRTEAYYPFNCGDILIKGFLTTRGTVVPPQMPTYLTTIEYLGDVSFTYKRIK